MIYNEIIYRPLLNLLVFLYNIIPGHDIGLVIIVVTILIRILLAPLMHKQLKGQKAMAELQPKLNELREKHKDDREAQAKAMMDLYREHKINPLASCFPLLVQLPILFALYQVFNKALGNSLTGLYAFVQNPGTIDPTFFGLVDLSKPNIGLALVAGALQYWQSRQLSGQMKSTDPTQKAMAIQTTYVLPLLSVFIAWNLPAGLPLYWAVTTLFAVLQQYYIMRKPKDLNVELGIKG